MTDSTVPLLTQNDTTDKEEQRSLPSLDSTIERCTGDMGWPQFLQAFLVSLAWLFDAQQTFISVFTDAHPTWHCTSPPPLNDASSSSCKSFSDICQLPYDSWAWDSPVFISTVSEWGLECGGSILAGLPTSSFFMGCLVGGLLLATLADSSLGRKNMLFLSCLIMSFSTFLTSFSSNIWIYSSFRFVTGFGRATIGTCALVLSTELVGKKWRGRVGVIGFFCFTIGFLSLPAMAYACRGKSWRYLYIWTSIPTLFYCGLVHYVVRESPRWLFVRGRKEEAVATLKAMINSSSQSRLNDVCFSRLSLEEETWNVNIYSALKVLVEKKWALKRLSAVMGIGFGIGIVYYGMPLSLGSLDFNLYLSVTLNALSEIPSSLITFLLINKLNRRTSLVIFCMISGVCSVMSVMKVNKVGFVGIGLELASFFNACTAFNMLLIFTLELFPTCVRNSAISMVRQALVLGGVFSPMLAAAGRKNEFMSYGVFGIVIGCCGLFALCLPETKGKPICDTLDEEECNT